MRLTNLDAVAVAVTANAGVSGTATLTFTATDYATATVTVEIMDAPTQPDPSIGLVVAPTVLWAGYWGEQANKYYGGNHGDDHDHVG